MHKILIVGGGFGGVKAVQDLARKAKTAVSIRLVDPKSYMEYPAAMYRMVTGRSPMEACIPYTYLLEGTDVDIVRDKVVSVDLSTKKAVGESGSRYDFETLILAVGSETAYFGIPGVQEHAFGIKTVDEALKLKAHMHELFLSMNAAKPEEKTPLMHIAVIGGGASGVELAGELAAYAKKLAKKHSVDPSFITIDLIEAMPRVLSSLPEPMSKRVEKRLRELGVNLLLNRAVIKEDVGLLLLQDIHMTAKTVIWTAGLKASSLLAKIQGITVDKRGRAEVDDHLRIAGHKNVYVIGDAASTKYSGMAQTALADAAFVATSIMGSLKGKEVSAYNAPAPAYAVPVGPTWAAVLYHGMRFYGVMGWFLRRAADARAFMGLLPLRIALRAFLSGHEHIEECPVCSK